MTGDQHLDLEPTAVSAQEGRIRPVTVAASALALGAVVLPDPARLSPVALHLQRLGRAAYLGWFTWDLTRRTPMPEVPASLFGAAAGAGLGLAMAPVDEATDAWAMRLMDRIGVRRPRLAIALAGAAAGTLAVLDNQTRPTEEDILDLMTPEDLFEAVEVPPRARDLIGAMLDAADPDGALGPAAPVTSASVEALREQLSFARASMLSEDVADLATDVFLDVPEDAPRAVPHQQTWPVRGHFEAGDLPLQLELSIGDGRLVGLSIMQRDADLAEDDPRWEADILDVLQEWPAPEQVRWVVETAEGYRPVG